EPERLFILIGNHDRINTNVYLTDESPFSPMKYWDKPPVIVDVPIMRDINGYKFLFVPYVPPGKLGDAINSVDVDLNIVSAVFAHQEIRGCKLNKFTVSKHGDRWPADAPPMFSGHIHEFDQLK